MLRILVACAAISSGLLTPLASTAQGASSTPTITVTAHASQRIAADRASISISVETRASTSAEAGSTNAGIERAVIAALVTTGLRERQITTSGYTVTEDWRRDSREKVVPGTRFLAANSVRVDVTDLDHIGRYIDAALAAGATSISSVTFSAGAADSTRRALLATAMVAARSDAAIMATAAGRSLGVLLEATTADPGGSAYAGAMANVLIRGVGSQNDPTPIAPREVEVIATVFTKWQLDPSKP